MKRKYNAVNAPCWCTRITWIMAVVLCLTLAGCQGQDRTTSYGQEPTQTETEDTIPIAQGIVGAQTEVRDPTPEEIVAAMEDASEFAYGWFWDNIHVDHNDVIYDDNVMEGTWPCERVIAEGVTSKEDVKSLTEEHFTPEETQALLATKEWIERDGSLYVSATEGLGGMSGNSLDVWITKDSNTQYTVTVQELLNGEEEPGISDPYSVHYRNVDGRWVFDGVVLTQNRPITLREQWLFSTKRSFCFCAPLQNQKISQNPVTKRPSQTLYKIEAENQRTSIPPPLALWFLKNPRPAAAFVLRRAGGFCTHQTFFQPSERNPRPEGIEKVNGYPDKPHKEVIPMPRDSEDWVHQLYVQHAPDLYRVAKYRLQDPELAYDLTQEVFLTLLDHPNRVKGHPNPGGWLRKTLQHKISHALSHRAVRARRDAGAEALDWLPAPDPAVPLEALLPRQLSDRDKALLTMAYEEGLTYQEMGRRLGVPPATCGTWLYRARQRCKHYLTLPEGGYPHENDPPHSPRGQ